MTGLYIYDGTASERAARLKPSPRGELEITDLNLDYLKSGNLRMERLGRGIAWLDTGTPTSMLQASMYIQVIEERQGLKVCCPEEVAYNLGLINESQLKEQAKALGKSALWSISSKSSGEKRMNLKVEKTPLEGLLVIAPMSFEDNRGYLAETYHQEKYEHFGITCNFVQDNQSYSVRGVMRGLHAQLKKPQAKLVRAVTGEIFDVAVDARPGFAHFWALAWRLLVRRQFASALYP